MNEDQFAMQTVCFGVDVCWGGSEKSDVLRALPFVVEGESRKERPKRALTIQVESNAKWLLWPLKMCFVDQISGINQIAANGLR